MQLTEHETRGLMTVSVFVSMVYVRFWHEAALLQRALLNDIKLLHLLHEYPERCFSAKASTVLRQHFWYFSEYLAPLALFNEQVDDDIKTAMVRNLSRAPKETGLKRLQTKTFDHGTPLCEYITSRSVLFFDLLDRRYPSHSCRSPPLYGPVINISRA